LLCILVAICRDEELFVDGSGVVMTVDGEVYMAMFFDVDKRVICSYPSVRCQDKKQYFDKLFDEDWCELNKDNLYHRSGHIAQKRNCKKFEILLRSCSRNFSANK